MSKSFSSLWTALGMLALLVVLFAGVSVSRADETSDAIDKAVAYLKTQPDDATKTMALVAAGESADVAYLKSFSGSSAIEYAKPIMAIAAAGENPATYPNEDLVAKLKSFADATQLGDSSQVNDDIWGILALRAAGVANTDSVIQNSKAFVLGNQNTDGGWAWNVGGDSDTNDTAVAIMALLEADVTSSDAAIQNALAYLKSAQNADGGFPYDPVSEFGTDSDGNSSAWVIMAFNKLGEDTSTIVPHLLSLQDTDGGFWWMAPPAAFNNKGPTADAVIALNKQSFPVTPIAGGGSVSSPEAFYRIVGSAGELCKGSVEAANAMEVVVNAADDCGFAYNIKDTSFGPYLESINEDVAVGTKGWMYLVNGESPSIGAVDYSLSGGESVLWYFAEFDADPPVMGDISESVDLQVNIVDSGNSGGGPSSGSGQPSVGFSVTPSELNFGELVPGNSVVDSLTVQNIGQKNLNVEVEVQGDSVFSFLKLDGALWNAFNTMLATGASKEVAVELAVPASFNVFGQKQGSLIFWATAN